MCGRLEGAQRAQLGDTGGRLAPHPQPLGNFSPHLSLCVSARVHRKLWFSAKVKKMSKVKPQEFNQAQQPTINGVSQMGFRMCRKQSKCGPGLCLQEGTPDGALGAGHLQRPLPPTHFPPSPETMQGGPTSASHCPRPPRARGTTAAEAGKDTAGMLLLHGGLLGVDGFADADGLGGDRGGRGQRPTRTTSPEGT